MFFGERSHEGKSIIFGLVLRTSTLKYQCLFHLKHSNHSEQEDDTLVAIDIFRVAYRKSIESYFHNWCVEGRGVINK